MKRFHHLPISGAFAIRHMTRLLPGRPVGAAARKRAFHTKIDGLSRGIADAPTLLRAESVRLDGIGRRCGSALVARMSWSFRLSAAWLDSLGAPERLVRYQRVIKRGPRRR